jgi:glycosyltransferase involved in cell wall biosynthesis
MNKRPTVSIVIPTYNHGHFLKKCLQSVIDQTFTNWEAIVVNNFSEDNTIEVVNSFHDPRIHLVNFKNNGIIAASRNKGIKLSRADLIAFLDSDDIWYPAKLNRCIQELTNDRDLVCHNLRYIRDGKYWKDVKCGPAKRASFNNLLYNGSCLVTSAVVVRKECLLRVAAFSEDPKIVTSEDYDLWLKLSKEKIRFYFIDEILGEYQIHESNASKSVLRHMHSALTVIEKYSASTGKANIWKHLKLRRKRALLLYGAARSYQQNGQPKEALRFYSKSVLTFPFISRTYAGMVLNLVP